jgi:SPP1 gp7 family putative phage head morphogenesis protein
MHNPFSQRAKLMRRRRLHTGNKPFKKPPKWLYPKAIEIKYRLFLFSFVKRLQDHAKRILFLQLPRLLDEADASRRADAWGDDVEKVLDAMSTSFDGEIADDAVRSFIGDIAAKTNDWNTKQFHGMVKAVVGIEHYAYEPWQGEHLKSFMQENIGLITKLKEDTYQNINRIVQSGIRRGDSYRSITKDILGTDLDPGVFTKVKDRAELIARDQIGKFNGELTTLRQKSIGISEYYWRTSNDGRVRDSHDALDGKLCKWDDDSVYSDDDGETWQPRTSEMFEGKPGEDFQCRCWAEAKFSSSDLQNEEEEE